MNIFTKTLSAALLVAALLPLTLLSGGCEREEPVRAYLAPKEPPKPPPPIDWAAPAAWQQLPASQDPRQQMRYAAYAVSAEHPDVILTVVPLPPSGLLANVHRWEGQLGLPPSAEADLGKVVQHIDLPTAHVDLVDLLGPEKPDGERQRLLGAVVPHDGQRTWFFKVMGPDSVVGKEKANFEALMRSVKLYPPASGAEGDSHGTPAAGPAPGPAPAPIAGPSGPDPHAAPAAPDAGEKLTKWTAPPDWSQDPQPRPMRTLSFVVGSGDRKAEVAVIRVPGQHANQLLSYVNIWRGEAGLPPAQDINMADAQKVTIAGKESPLLEFAGPEGAAEPQKRVFLATAVRAQNVWFFKLSGDAQTALAQKDAFHKFLASIEFGG